jgi:hypothetical protein
MSADSSGYTTTLPGGKKITVASKDVAEQTYGTPEYRDAVKRYYDAGGLSGTGKNFKKWLSEKQAERAGRPSQVVMPHGPPSQVKLASSKIALIQSLLRICEGNKEFSMTKSGDSDLILEEKVAAPKFLGLTLGSPKKGYTARISLDEAKKEVKYHEMSSLFTKTLGKAQDNPLADRMRGSIRQVVESAGWRFYTS